MSQILRAKFTLNPLSGGHPASHAVNLPMSNVAGEVVACRVRYQSGGARVRLMSMQSGNIGLLLDGFENKGIDVLELMDLPIRLPINPGMRLTCVLESTEKCEGTVTVAVVTLPEPPPAPHYKLGLVPDGHAPWGPGLGGIR